MKNKTEYMTHAEKAVIRLQAKKANKQKRIHDPQIGIIPQVGQTYKGFDSGRIREYRQKFITIDKVIPFEDADKEADYYKHWQRSIEYWGDCFPRITSHFVFSGDYVFVWGEYALWWALGEFIVLDVDGELERVARQNKTFEPMGADGKIIFD